MPYLLQQYNAKSLIGPSVGKQEIPQFGPCCGKEPYYDSFCGWDNQLNVALSGAFSSNWQIEIDHLKLLVTGHGFGIDGFGGFAKWSQREQDEYKSGWKVLTIMMGMNDALTSGAACSGDKSQRDSIAHNFEDHMTALFDYLVPLQQQQAAGQSRKRGRAKAPAAESEVDSSSAEESGAESDDAGAVGNGPVDGEDVYEVDRILDRRRRFYKIRWKGFGAADDTWKTRANIAPKLVRAFLLSRGFADGEEPSDEEDESEDEGDDGPDEVEVEVQQDSDAERETSQEAADDPPDFIATPFMLELDAREREACPPLPSRSDTMVGDKRALGGPEAFPGGAKRLALDSPAAAP